MDTWCCGETEPLAVTREAAGYKKIFATGIAYSSHGCVIRVIGGYMDKTINDAIGHYY
jgi:hypothetical protein